LYSINDRIHQLVEKLLNQIAEEDPESGVNQNVDETMDYDPLQTLFDFSD